MPPYSRDDRAFSELKSAVRASAWGPGLAALLLLYFAYAGSRFQVPEGNGAFEIGGRIVVHTLEIGAWLMVLVTLCLLIGRVWALLFDAVAAILVGLAFCVAAGLMMLGGGGGFQSGLYGVFGLVFVLSGARTGGEWNRLRRFVEFGPGESNAAMPATPAPTDSLPSQLRKNMPRTQIADPALTGGVATEEAPVERAAGIEPVAPKPPPSATGDVRSAEGFLASFAPEEDREDREHE
jgi:hypothetical protein